MARRATTKSRRKTQPKLSEYAAGQRVWVLQIPWGVRHPDVKWFSELSVWVYAGNDLPADLLPYRSVAYSLARRIEDNHNGFPGPPAKAAPKTPRPDQVEAAKAIVSSCLRWSGAHLGSAVGQGKTLSAILAAKALLQIRDGSSVLVVVDRPQDITSESWRESIAGVGDGGYQWLIVSPDQLKKLVGRNGKPRYTFDVCLIDETQNFRHLSQQTAALRRVAQLTASRMPAIVTITNTLGHNPSEYLVLAPLLASIHAEPVAAWTDLGAKLISKGLPLEPNKFATGEYTWSEVGRDPALQAKATSTVRRWMERASPPALIYQPPRWGPAPVHAIPVDLSAGQYRQYQEAWAEFRKANQIARTSGDSEAGRVAMLRLRQKASFIRVSHTVDLALAQVRKGRQPVIAMEWIATAGAPIADALDAAGVPCARLFGDNECAAERIAFQRGHKVVAVTNKTSAISLHANERMGDGSRSTGALRVGLFHQPRFSGIHARQTIGRTHRDGQVSPWFFLYARQTVEEEAAAVMVSRLQSAAASTSGEVSAWQEIASAFGVEWLLDDGDEL